VIKLNIYNWSWQEEEKQSCKLLLLNTDIAGVKKVVRTKY
jgi:hypothetical protein